MGEAGACHRCKAGLNSQYSQSVELEQVDFLGLSIIIYMFIWTFHPADHVFHSIDETCWSLRDGGQLLGFQMWNHIADITAPWESH